MATEIELKLTIDAAHVAYLRRHPALRSLTQGKPRRQRLHSVYFDTPELDLLRAGVALRLRRVGGRWVQTVKGGGSVAGGLHQRDEWEWPVQGGAPDLTLIAETSLAAIMTDALQARLRPVFVTQFWRTAWQLRTAQGAEIELALDQGEVQAGEQRMPISEVELELKAGEAESLFEVALALQERVPLRVEDLSKAQRGYLLASGATLPPRTAQRVALAPRMPVAQAFRDIAGECLAQFQGNVAGLGQDPEYLHQARVAVRRLRSALSLFGAELSEAPADVVKELRWLMSRLGPARDWDVFVTQTLPPIVAEFANDRALARLQAAATRLRDASGQAARDAVASQRYTRLALTLGLWLARQTGPGPISLADFAAQMLARQHKRLRRKGKHHATLSPTQRHALRIAAKKLRYAAEFFAVLYPRKRTRPYLAALAALQDVLGALNDARVTQRLLAEMPSSRAQAAGVVSGWMACVSRERLVGLDRAWRDFVRQKVFWK